MAVQAVFLSGRRYPTAASQLSDRFFDLKLENEKMLNRLAELELEPEPQRPADFLPTGVKTEMVEPSEASPPASEEVMSPSGGPKKKPIKRHKAGEATDFVCTSCGTTISPEWRKGPTGRQSSHLYLFLFIFPSGISRLSLVLIRVLSTCVYVCAIAKTLCNACGLRWSKKPKSTSTKTKAPHLRIETSESH